MKWLCYAAALLTAILMPAERTDIGSLKPMEVIKVTVEDGVLLQTDTEDWGRGSSLAEAFENLHASTSGIVYLDTVEYVLLDKVEINLVQELGGYLRGSVDIYKYEGDVDPSEAGEYLDVHGVGKQSGHVILEKEGDHYVLKN